MNLGTLIQTNGYWVLAVGCLLEGETILILAGFAAHSGYLNPLAVIVIASTAGFAGDQIFFWLGRRHGSAVLTRWPSVATQHDRLQRLIRRYRAAVIIGIRFVYGLRIAGPVLLGMSTVSGSRFATFNALGAVIWACIIGGMGWAFGHAAETLMGEINHLGGWVLLGLVLIGAAAWWIRRRRGR